MNQISAPEAVLSTHALACSRGERHLFSGMELAVRPGELLLVQGGNGRGKTSLLRLLTGLSSPEQGEVRWRGESIRNCRDTFHREMAYIGHTNSIKDDLTPIENLRMTAGLGGRAMDEGTAENALVQMGLARCLDLPCRVLSFGQRRRVALASLLAAGATLWILDEPLTGLDVDGVALLERLLAAHVGAGGMVVMTTHQPLTLAGEHIRILRVGDSDVPGAG